MRACDILDAVEKLEEEKKALEEKKEAALKQKQQTKEAFYRCKQKYCCGKEGGACVAADFKECSICHNILKSQCSKMYCRNKAG